eukprot:s1385_g11.t1
MLKDLSASFGTNQAEMDNWIFPREMEEYTEILDRRSTLKGAIRNPSPFHLPSFGWRKLIRNPPLFVASRRLWLQNRYLPLRRLIPCRHVSLQSDTTPVFHGEG